MAIDTKKIILEQVTFAEFEKMSKFWGKRIREKDNTIYSRIITPIIETDYLRLLVQFFDNEYLHKMKWNRNGWKKQPKDELSHEEIEKIAQIASRDERKKTYLEMELRHTNNSPDLDRISTVIEFVGREGEIISNDIRIRYAERELFDIQSRRDRYTYNHGLWTP